MASFFQCLAIFAFLIGSAIQHVLGQTGDTPLDKFIAAPDPNYKWVNTGKTEQGTNVAGHWTAYLINMTSQMWLNSSFVDRPIWWHWLWVIVPDNMNPKYADFATMVGTGNSNSNNPPSKGDEYFRASQYMATHSKTLIAVLYNIPNEPLVFLNDINHKRRTEDAIIAFGWHIFSQYPADDDYRYNWLTHFPMAKATVRAMDTVQAFGAQSLNLPNIQRWATAGASKRGWSTWLTAAADDRVKAFIPMVMDMPNFLPNLHHMWRAYGGWTFAFADYYEMNLTMSLDDQWFKDLLEACDPYSFFDRYANKWKMGIDAVNDEFFMPDDEHYWWKEFPAPKYFQMNPDAEHSLSTAIEELVPTLATFVVLYLEQDRFSMPVIDWTITNVTGNMSITFTGNTSLIVDAKVWHGRSCGRTRRDFRIINLDSPCPCGIPVNNGEYCVNVESLFAPFDLKPSTMSATVATYNAGPSDVPDNHWSGFMVSLRLKFFDAEHPWITDDKYWEDFNRESPDDRAFLVEYGEVQFTTQVSIMPQTFPFPPCQGTACYGTLV